MISLTPFRRATMWSGRGKLSGLKNPRASFVPVFRSSFSFGEWRGRQLTLEIRDGFLQLTDLFLTQLIYILIRIRSDVFPLPDEWTLKKRRKSIWHSGRPFLGAVNQSTQDVNSPGSRKHVNDKTIYLQRDRMG